MNNIAESSKLCTSYGAVVTPTVIVLLLTETVLVELLKVLTASMVYSPAGTVGGMVHTRTVPSGETYAGEIFSDMVGVLSTTWVLALNPVP